MRVSGSACRDDVAFTECALLRAPHFNSHTDCTMSLDLTSDQGTPLDQQRFTWRELVPRPLSKLDDDPFTRVRVILMNGIEHEKLLFNAAAIRCTEELRPALARVMRLEHFQQQMVNWLLSPDMSPLET